MSTDLKTADPAPVVTDKGESRRRWIAALSFRDIGAVYVLIVIVIVSSIALPNVFPNMATLRQVLNDNAVTALAALAIVVPLCAGVFDLSFAYTMSLAGVTAAHFVASTSLGIPVAVALGVGVGVVVGVINGFVVVTMKIDSFIGTLATGSLIQALITFVTNDNDITSAKLLGGFSDIGQSSIDGFVLPVLYVLILAAVLWRLLEHHSLGRRIYATGFNREAARLAGIRTDRIRFGSLVLSGFLAAIAGVVLDSTLGSGSTTAGTPYLLSGFAATFLGATQLKPGRFNAWGTVIAVLLLGTGLTTLALANAADWTGSMFTGVVLILALFVAGAERRSIRSARGWWSRLSRQRPPLEEGDEKTPAHDQP